MFRLSLTMDLAPRCQAGIARRSIRWRGMVPATAKALGSKENGGRDDKLRPPVSLTNLDQLGGLYLEGKAPPNRLVLEVRGALIVPCSTGRS